MENSLGVVVKLQDVVNNMTYAIQLSEEDAFRVQNDEQYAREMLNRIKDVDAAHNEYVEDNLQNRETKFADEFEENDEDDDEQDDQDEMEYEEVEYLEQFDTQESVTKKRWSSAQSAALLNAVAEHFDDIKHPKKRKLGWATIADSLQEIMAPMKIDSQDCRIKWRNLVRTYLNVKRNLKETGRGPLKFEFYEEIANILEGETTKMCCALSVSKAAQKIQEQMLDESLSPRPSSNFLAENFFLCEKQLLQNGTNSKTCDMNPSKKFWSRDQTSTLISAVETHYAQLKNPKKRKQSWNIVSEELKDYGVMVSASDCRFKWNSLVHSYAIVRNSKLRNESSPVKFPYYKEMDKILGNELNNLDTESDSTSTELNQVPGTSEECSFSASPTPFLPSPSNGMTDLDRSKYFKLRQEKHLKKQEEWKKRHAERKEKILLQKQELELEERKVALLERYLKLLNQEENSK